ncbi:hypothetical protein KUTeg_004008 [Tegillarca granosa]|uniref:Uncharacterized protein n=1 Tax=Tegillarca granosa TaxID=220873 RepID=A0ABQ9FQK2_TEGGR|nr:hypothetical protein KUTeg_004008 [Tegillarca granosa]
MVPVVLCLTIYFSEFAKICDKGKFYCYTMFHLYENTEFNQMLHQKDLCSVWTKFYCIIREGEM